ncbi:TetR/AcrR family transcriptional regulator [Niveibacterium sp. SC-1]|uniref:TetR/AcrR family transcriptional regulator n=1 Tax=Niveibacterium sp. SC-1 TaxID=3135646 RepID=UPI00311E1D56
MDVPPEKPTGNASRGLRADGEATRARILEAAGELFAAGGYADTTSKAIAARAGVDQASINYHFGSRSGLYQALLADAHRRLVSLADLRQLAESRLAPAQKLRTLIEQLVQRATGSTQGWHLKVLVREILAPSPHCQTLFQEEIFPKVFFVRRLISEITAIPEDDPAITRCLLSVMAPCLMLLLGTSGIPGPVQELLRMPGEALSEHLHRYALAGLTAIAQEHAG